MTQNLRVAIGMSGGVDSSVACALLAKDYEPVGVTIRFMRDADSDQAIHDARLVCDKLGIEHHVFDAAACFESLVIDPFVSAYQQGLTPSPCVVCNARVKFPSLLSAADQYDCAYIATGHYAQVVEKAGRFAIALSSNAAKDQSYMLAALDQKTLARLVLPLGPYSKEEVRNLASAYDLPFVASKSDSQDICFAPNGYRDLLELRGVDSTPGPIVNRQGEVLGTHDGLLNYTVGQRKGIGIAAAAPLYVLEKRADTNELVVGFADESLISYVDVEQCCWNLPHCDFRKADLSGKADIIEKADLSGKADIIEKADLDNCDGGSLTFECKVKLRYRALPQECCVTVGENGLATIDLKSPVDTTAPGQFAVFYLDSEVVGAGVIARVSQ